MSDPFLATIVHSLSPEGRGRGEGARTHENNTQLPNPLTLAHFVRSTSPLWGEVRQIVLPVLCIGVCEDLLPSGRKFSLFSSFYSLFPNSFSQSVISSLKKLRGRSADRRHYPVSAPRKVRVATHSALGARARHTGRARLPALRRGTCGSERTPPLSFSPHFLGPGVIGCYPHLACPFSPASCPAVPVIVPDGRIRRSRPGAGYEAARGNRTRSISGIVSRNALTRARCFGFNPIRRRLSNAVAELGTRRPCKSLKWRLFAAKHWIATAPTHDATESENRSPLQRFARMRFLHVRSNA
jgi:hypothetical protein